MKHIKLKVISCCMCVFCLFTQSMPVFAQENQQSKISITESADLPDGWIIDDDGNYCNPSTGEYFKWTSEKSHAKSAHDFSFKIRYSVTSKSFTVNSTSVTVTSDAHLEDKYGAWHSKSGGFDYQVSIIGIYARNLNFNTNGSQRGVVSNLINGGTYRVSIGTGEPMPLDKDGDQLYLVGSGSVINN